jgi:uracil-DNA glycosylase family 4
MPAGQAVAHVNGRVCADWSSPMTVPCQVGGDASSASDGEGDRVAAFAGLVHAAHQCRACARMEGRTRVLGPANGSLHPLVLFVAEAPGRLGADRTAVPLCGDQSGRNFDRLLAVAGLDRASVFVTNAVLCNPRDAADRNAPPSRAEIRTCSGFLAGTIALLQPPWVVALGAVALRALAAIEPHGLTLAANVGEVVSWHGRLVMPLYHPGPRAQLHRSFDQQIEDFRRLGAHVRSIVAPATAERTTPGQAEWDGALCSLPILDGRSARRAATGDQFAGRGGAR